MLCLLMHRFPTVYSSYQLLPGQLAEVVRELADVPETAYRMYVFIVSLCIMIITYYN